MNQKTLDIIGRRHTVEQVKEAFYLARERGFDNINMDMILGLPGEEVSDVRHTVDELCKLNPDSLTVHSLAVKRAAAMRDWIRNAEGRGAAADASGVEAMMSIADRGARSLGMSPYYLYRQKNISGIWLPKAR
jgi:oxygen-independent coproporphyrinogen-3 oxidase